MSDMITSLCRVSIVLAYWIFTALMINRTLRKSHGHTKTILYWTVGLLGVTAASVLSMSIYGLKPDEIPLDYVDIPGYIHNMLVTSSAIIGTVIVSLLSYKDSKSVKVFVSLFFALIGLVITDIVTNISKIILPVDQYFTSVYYTYQVVIVILMMVVLLLFTYLKIADLMRSLFDKVKGNVQEFIFASVISTLVYILMVTYFNMQTTSAVTDSQLITRIVFIVLCITIYLIIIYGVRRTITNLQLGDELHFAKEIQLSILPSDNVFSNIHGLKIAAKMIPLHDIGGDFYDVFKLDDNRTAFIIADVAGKGIPAAMFMMRTKSFLKTNMLQYMEAGNTLTYANKELFADNDACMFYTAVVGVFDSKTSVFKYSCGGHYPPVLIRDGAAVSCESVNDPVVGIKEYEYKEFEISLKKGDIIFLYTDGVLDTVSKSRERYGRERFMDLLSVGSEPDSLVSDLIADVDEFCSGGDYADDLTVLAFKVE